MSGFTAAFSRKPQLHYAQRDPHEKHPKYKSQCCPAESPDDRADQPYFKLQFSSF